MKIGVVDIQNISGQQVIQLPNDLRINDDKVYLKKLTKPQSSLSIMLIGNSQPAPVITYKP